MLYTDGTEGIPAERALFRMSALTQFTTIWSKRQGAILLDAPPFGRNRRGARATADVGHSKVCYKHHREHTLNFVLTSARKQ